MISNRTRRIVQHSMYPLKEIDVHPGRSRSISIGRTLDKTENKIFWHFLHDDYAYDGNLVLQRGSHPLRTSRDFEYYLRSYTAGDSLNALKMGIDFMIEVFRCTIGRVFVSGNEPLDPLRLGISSVKELIICKSKPVSITDLKCLLETVNVTDKYVFDGPIPEEFYCDPQIFNCRRLSFTRIHSADWVTLELLCQFDASQLYFSYQRFSAEDIVSYITHWFNSENRKLEYAHFVFDNPVSQEDFKIEHLNPMPFDGEQRNRCPSVKEWKNMDMSSGKDILRQDGLLATFYINFTSVIFHVWHKRFPDAVSQ